MPDPYQTLLDDLAHEQAYLDDALAPLPDADFELPTPCRGWMVRDVIAHLAEVDDSAAAIASGAADSMGGGDRSLDGTRSSGQDRARLMTRLQLIDWWRGARGPSPGRPPSARRQSPPALGRAAHVRPLLRHRPPSWSAGRTASTRSTAPPSPRSTPTASSTSPTWDSSPARSHIKRADSSPTPNPCDLRVELTLPSGAQWSRGEADAAHLIRGAAGDFCRVATQRIHYLDTALQYTPGAAEEFLQVAQAFAGPPGEGRPPARLTPHVSSVPFSPRSAGGDAEGRGGPRSPTRSGGALPPPTTTTHQLSTPFL